MRFVIYGAGAVGGVVGARLSQHGHDVVLIARGPHFDAIRDRGLRVDSGEESVTLRVPVVDTPARVAWTTGDVAVLAMKTQATAAALSDLSASAPADLPVVCAQNAVENERLALGQFERVYGVCVMCPTGHLEPGVVQAFSVPVTGIMDIGRYPDGVDDVATSVAAAFSASTFVSEARPDIMRWKYRKLIMNLGNAAEAVCGPEARIGELGRRATEEGEAALAAAGIDVASIEEDAARRGDLLRIRPAAGQRWKAGSSWQSLARGTGNIEADHLNGEIVLLGQAHGVPTPVNSLLQRLANQAAGEGWAPGAMTEADVLNQIA
ncbi:MAG: ketopantoate reductase family protein [Actinobacteria bacterium]|nr:ketopantoate reductase family protein [Actinomycetota bacterium]